MITRLSRAQSVIAEALELGVEAITARMWTLAVQLREHLAKLPQMRLHDPARLAQVRQQLPALGHRRLG